MARRDSSADSHLSGTNSGTWGLDLAMGSRQICCAAICCALLLRVDAECGSVAGVRDPLPRLIDRGMARRLLYGLLRGHQWNSNCLLQHWRRLRYSTCSHTVSLYLVLTLIHVHSYTVSLYSASPHQRTHAGCVRLRVAVVDLWDHVLLLLCHTGSLLVGSLWDLVLTVWWGSLQHLPRRPGRDNLQLSAVARPPVDQVPG